MLKHLYDKLYIAEAVWDELNHGGKQYPGSQEVAEAAWITRHKVKNRALVTALQRDLDHGEAESIALAIELNADLILLDEKEGRHIANRFNLPMIGVVGILLEAHLSGKVDHLSVLLDSLRQQAGFYISQSLYDTVIQHSQQQRNT